MTATQSRIARFSLVLLMSAPSLALAASKKYQVTGKVVSFDDKTLVVLKGDEKFEMDRSANLKIDGDLKVGAKVTVYYHIIADSAEIKK